jgi:hypothetical protein
MQLFIGTSLCRVILFGGGWDGGEGGVLYVSLFIFHSHTNVLSFYENQISITKLILVVTTFPPPTWMTTFGRTNADQLSMCIHRPMAMLTMSPDSSSPP